MFKVNFDEAVDVHTVPTTSAADVLKETMEFHHITQTEFA